MQKHSGMPNRWNLFTRELETLLHARGRNLNDLVSEIGLHPEKVRRLKQSLVQPRFHILNPEDVEQISQTFSFTGDEQLRMRAAILATAVEETLMNRIDPENALRAAEELFPLLVDALRQRFGRLSGLAATRKMSMADDTSMSANENLDPILERFDQAMLALHLSRQSLTDRERREQATQARDRFTIVLADLNALSVANPDMRQDDAWQLWHQETQKNLAMVEEHLERLQQQY